MSHSQNDSPLQEFVVKGGTALGLEAVGRLRVGRIFRDRNGEGTLAQSGTRPRGQRWRGRRDYSVTERTYRPRPSPRVSLGVYREDLSPLDFLVAQRSPGARARTHPRAPSKAAGSWFSE